MMLLATDGLPDTCETLAERGGEAAAISVVEDAFESGIMTFVVGVGDVDDADITAHLQDLANAGAGFPVGGPENVTFYQGLSENSLIGAVSEIINLGAQSCVYELEGMAVADGMASEGTVRLNGVALEHGVEWRLKSPGEIELLSEICDEIQTGVHTLEADFPCEGIVSVV
jgi:hypothetical protein